jgi:uncharacterized membrane protein
MEAFSDGVIAILITVMVLELHVPHGTNWTALHHSTPQLLTYVLSFVYLGIYWNNHHHMLMLTGRVDGLVLWANLHLLFWLSLIPFTTGWMGENHFPKIPVAVYGIVLLAAGAAYLGLQTAIIRTQKERTLADAIGGDFKGKASPVLYIAGIALAFVNRWIAISLYVIVALMWLIPDRRVERTIAAHEQDG